MVLLPSPAADRKGGTEIGFAVGFVDYNLKLPRKQVYRAVPRRAAAARHEVASCYGMIETFRSGPSARGWWLARPEEVRRRPMPSLLAPDNAEVHLDLAQRVFPAGKPTYVDKTCRLDRSAADD